MKELGEESHLRVLRTQVIRQNFALFGMVENAGCWMRAAGDGVRGQ